jgi:hypothetical protein
LCDDSQKHTYANTERHEKSAFHRTLVQEADHREADGYEEAGEEGSSIEPLSATTLPPILAMIDDATHNLLASLATPSSRGVSHPADSPEPEPFPIEGWGLFEANEDTELSVSLEQQSVALIARSLRERFDELSVGSADDVDADERSQVDEDEIAEPTVTGKSAPASLPKSYSHILAGDDASSQPPIKRSRNVRNDDSLNPSAKWFPWRDKIVSEVAIMIKFSNVNPYAVTDVHSRHIDASATFCLLTTPA